MSNVTVLTCLWRRANEQTAANRINVEPSCGSGADEMKTPLLLVPLVLVWSLADGAIVSKCELRDELENSIGNLKVTYRQETLTGDDLVAKSESWEESTELDTRLSG